MPVLVPRGGSSAGGGATAAVNPLADILASLSTMESSLRQEFDAARAELTFGGRSSRPGSSGGVGVGSASQGLGPSSPSARGLHTSSGGGSAPALLTMHTTPHNSSGGGGRTHPPTHTHNQATAAAVAMDATLSHWGGSPDRPSAAPTATTATTTSRGTGSAGGLRSAGTSRAGSAGGHVSSNGTLGHRDASNASHGPALLPQPTAAASHTTTTAAAAAATAAKRHSAEPLSRPLSPLPAPASAPPPEVATAAASRTLHQLLHLASAMASAPPLPAAGVAAAAGPRGGLGSASSNAPSLAAALAAAGSSPRRIGSGGGSAALLADPPSLMPMSTAKASLLHATAHGAAGHAVSSTALGAPPSFLTGGYAIPRAPTAIPWNGSTLGLGGLGSGSGAGSALASAAAGALGHGTRPVVPAGHELPTLRQQLGQV